MKALNICVVRHGETDWNAAGRLQGREDIPLNDNGRLQARQCGLSLRLQGETLGNWGAVVTSPLKRATETAQIIAGILGIDKIIDDETLVERDFGKASGMLLGQREKHFPDGIFAEAENWEIMRRRVWQGVEKNARKLEPTHIIIVSHGAAINALINKVSNGELGTGITQLKNACMNLFMFKNQKLELMFHNKTYDELEHDCGGFLT